MGVPRKTGKITNDDTRLSVRIGERRVGKHVRQSTGITELLPRDLLVDVLGRVASSSFDDLYSAKLSCKDFEESTNDDYIFEHISIDKFSVIHWFPPRKSVLSFLTQCFEKGNSESLFRQGMIDYFKLVNMETGLEYMKKAVGKGHLEATYVYGMILLSSGDDQASQHGLNLLNSMKYSRPRHWNVQDCRDKIGSILSQIWINHPVTLEKVDTRCQERDHTIRFERRGWSLDEDEKISSCDKCLWYRELINFCKMMNATF